MTCDDCLLLMEDDLEAELAERRASLLASHVASCSNCAREYQTLQRERQIYSQYSHSRRVEVSPALWSAVRTRLEGDLKSPRSTHWRSLREWFAGTAMTPRFAPVLTAGLILLVIGISLVILRYVNLGPHETRNGAGSEDTRRDVMPPSRAPSLPAGTGNPDAGLQAQRTASQSLSSREEKEAIPNAGRKVVERTLRAKHTVTVEDLVEQAEQKYLAAIVILSRDVKRRGPQLDPELHARIEETLAAIDRTIADTRQAVRQRPTDPEAVRYMLTAYAKKVEVLQELASY